MDIEIRYVEDCPHVDTVAATVDAILAEAGASTQVKRHLISDLEVARELGFVASPTVVVDGTAIPSDAGEPSLACRLHLPSDDELRHAILKGAR